MRKDSILQQYYYKKLPKYQDKGEVVLPPYPIPRSSFMGDEVIPNPIPKDEFIKRSKQSIPQAVDFWKNWYAGRQTLPQFKDVSERRLKLLEQPVDVQYLQPTQLMKENTVGRYIPETKKMELVDPLNEYVSKGSRDDIDSFNEFMSIATGIPVVGHELFHKLGYQAPQGNINTLTRYPHSPSFERTSKPIFAPPKQYGIPKEQYEYYSLEQMIPSAKRNKRSEFPSEKTTIFHPEMEAGVAMLRMAENMDPTKTYTKEDFIPIIDKYSKYNEDNLKYDLPPEGYESQHNSWFINRMFQMLGNDPDKIAKYLNSVARTTQRKPLDFAKHGGLVKAQYGIPSARELANQNQSYSTDAALAAKMQADAQAARLKSKMLSAAKESYITPARKSTPQEQQMRMIRNRTYQAQNAPYTRMNAQGDLSRAIPNVSMSGQPDVRTPEARWQKGSEHMMNALEAAGAMQGLGYLGRQGYNAARAALAESMESGLLSNTYKINPWRFKPNPEAYYHRTPNIENIVNRETGMLQGFGESEAGKQFTQNAIVKQSGINLQKGANSRLYFSKGTPLDYGRTNMILDEKTGKLIPGQGYPGPYIVEVEGVPMGASTKGRVPGVEPTRIGSYAVSRRPISANEAKYYKEDWLRGYKEVPKPTRFTTTSKGLSTPTADELPEYLRPYIGRTEPEYSDAEKIWRSWFKGEAPPMPTKSAKPPVLSSATTSTSISAPGQRMDVTFGRAGDDVTRTSMEFPENADEYRKFLRQQQLKKEAGDILRREGLPNIRYSGSYQAPTNKLVWRDPNTGEIRHQLGAESYEGFKTPELFNLAKKDLSDYKRKYWQQLIDQRNASLNSARLLAEYGKQRKVPEYYVRNPKDLTRFLGELGEYANPSTQMYHRGKDLGEKLEDFVPMEKSHLYDKKDMYHILTPNKHGGIIEDNRGQWAHPGKNTRISSPNITMDGVPYPVLAKANTGEERMMYPNQDYYFPGAEYVDEYPMMQKGGIPCPGNVCGPGRMDGEPTAIGNLLRNVGSGVGNFFGNIFTRKGKGPRFKTKYTAHLVENAEPNFLFYNFTGGAPSPAKSSTPVYDDAIVFNSPSGLKTTSLETSNVENMTYGSAEYGGPLVEYYKGRMTGPNMFQVGGFNLIPPAVTNPYIQKAISSITNFLMPSSSQSQELEQGKIPTKISNELLLKQAFKESQFNPKAVSPKGYKGLTQIGQDIIADYIKKTGVKNIDPFNPKHAKDIQEYAMNSLYNADFINKPNQSDQVRIAKTLAAYNWGRGNLSNFLNEKKKKGMDIYKSLDWMKDLPTETSDYINKILLNKSSDFNQQFQKSITNPTYKSIVSLYKEHGGQSNEGYYNYNYGVPEFEYGGPGDDEIAFQKFFKTLPNNLRKDTPNYNIRGYWDALGRPESFDYSQFKEADGYYHAFSRHPKTGEMLKRPQHPTFKMAIEEDRKAGYFPIVTPDGKIKTVSGKDFAGGGEYHHGYYDQYGGDISIPQLPNMQKPLLQYYYNKIK